VCAEGCSEEIEVVLPGVVLLVLKLLRVREGGRIVAQVARLGKLKLWLFENLDCRKACT
jgi:hypothetical protein